MPSRCAVPSRPIEIRHFGTRGVDWYARERKRRGPESQPKTDKNPTGPHLPVSGRLRVELANNRPQFYGDITLPFSGYNRPGAKIPEGIREHWWLQGMLGAMKAHYDCIKAFPETDPLSAKLVKNSTLKIYPGFTQRDAHNQCRPVGVHQEEPQSGSVRVIRPPLDGDGRVF